MFAATLALVATVSLCVAAVARSLVCCLPRLRPLWRDVRDAPAVIAAALPRSVAALCRRRPPRLHARWVDVAPLLGMDAGASDVEVRLTRTRAGTAVHVRGAARGAIAAGRADPPFRFAQLRTGAQALASLGLERVLTGLARPPAGDRPNGGDDLDAAWLLLAHLQAPAGLQAALRFGDGDAEMVFGDGSFATLAAPVRGAGDPAVAVDAAAVHG